MKFKFAENIFTLEKIWREEKVPGIVLLMLFIGNWTNVSEVIKRPTFGRLQPF